METKRKRKGPYLEVRDLAQSEDVRMWFRPGGNAGGVWKLRRGDIEVEVPIYPFPNRLDLLYKDPSEKHWDQVNPSGNLVPDARERLISLLEHGGSRVEGGETV